MQENGIFTLFAHFVRVFLRHFLKSSTAERMRVYYQDSGICNFIRPINVFTITTYYY